jgi:hypothetical protein
MMNKKAMAIGITLLMIVILFGSTNFVFNVHSTSIGTRGGFSQDNTLITEWYGNRVIEINSTGNIIWQKTGLNEPFDSEILANGNILIADWQNDRVIEVDHTGNIVWEISGLNEPVDAERLNNGNTLIAEWTGGRIIEVDSAGNIVWEKTGLTNPVDAERLDNGNTLISNYGKFQIIEVDSSNNIIWQKNMKLSIDIERLANGNTLITEFIYNRVFEIDSSGNMVWQKAGLNGPMDAERLDNGNTLITERFGNRVIEVDSSGNIVWQKIGLIAPSDVERLDNQLINVDLDLTPSTLNLKSEGRWISGYIYLPDGYNASEINLGTVKLNDSIPVDWGEAKKSTLMVKFDRSDVEDLIGMPNESEELIVTGKTTDGTTFFGNETIRAIKLTS